MTDEADDSQWSWDGRNTWILIHGIISAVIGLVLAEIIAFSLIEISLTIAFSITFGVGFCLLGMALAWRICLSVRGVGRKVTMFCFALVVFATGVSCFFLDSGWPFKMTPGGKIPLYSMLGISFAFSFTFAFLEIISLSPCDKCCKTDLKRNPLFGNPPQVLGLFAGALLMGGVFGLTFGVTESPQDLSLNSIYGIPIGIIFGGIIGAVNQWYRTRQVIYEPIKDPEEDTNY